MIRGQNPFTSTPRWTIEGVPLTLSETLPYLGASLDNRRGASHVDLRVRAAQRAYYALQSTVRKIWGKILNEVVTQTIRQVEELLATLVMTYFPFNGWMEIDWHSPTNAGENLEKIGHWSQKL